MLARRFPIQALAACDALWTDDHLEPRLFAAIMLGQMPSAQTDAVLERLRLWSRPDEDRQMLDALFNQGTLRLRRETPDPLLNLIQGWLTNQETPTQMLGLKALLAIINDEAYHYFPPMFRLLVPLLQNVPTPLMNELNTILRALAHRTPAETDLPPSPGFEHVHQPQHLPYGPQDPAGVRPAAASLTARGLARRTILTLTAAAATLPIFPFSHLYGIISPLTGPAGGECCLYGDLHKI